MGYYTTIEIDLKIKKEKIDEFNAKWQEELVREGKDKRIGYYEDLSVAGDCGIEFEEYSRKWYESECFYGFIKDYVEAGFIQGHGEEFGDVWKVVFDGQGSYSESEVVFMNLELPFGNIISSKIGKFEENCLKRVCDGCIARSVCEKESWDRR